MADYRSPVDIANEKNFGFGQTLDQANSLADFLKQKQQFQQQQADKFALQKQAEDLASQGAAERMNTVEKLSRKYPGKSVTMGKEQAGISTPGAMLTQPLKEEENLRKGQEAYSKRLEKVNEFASTLKQINDLSNRTGEGGILTNPKAKLISTGKGISMLPDATIGGMEAIGALPKGTSEERKSLARLAIDYAAAKGGVRGLSPAIMQKEKEALGWIGSGDPDLVAKGVRSLSLTMKYHLRTIKSGYVPQVQERVHTELGGDPEAQFEGIYDDNSHLTQANTAPPLQTGTAPQTSGIVPPGSVQSPVDPQMQRYLDLKRKYGK